MSSAKTLMVARQQLQGPRAQGLAHGAPSTPCSQLSAAQAVCLLPASLKAVLGQRLVTPLAVGVCMWRGPPRP